MSFLGDFVGGAAESGAGIIGNQIKRQADLEERQTLAQQQSDLETEREKTITAFRSQLAQKPLNDFASAVAMHQNDTVPVETPTTTNGITDRASMIGVDGQPLNGNTPGLSGNVAALRQQILNAPDMLEDDRRGALSQLDAQVQQQIAANPTRKASPAEAADFGMQDLLKSGNGAAYAAGRPLMIDKTMSVPDGGAVIDPRTGRVLFQNTSKADRQLAHEDFLTQQQTDRLDQQEKLKRLELDPLGINAATAGNAPTGSAAQAIAQGLHGKELLDAIPATQAEMVKALAEGRVNFPTGAALRSPTWASLLTLVGQYDPSFDGVNAGARAATRKDFTSGKAAQSVNALNTVLGHLDSLGSAADELNNSSMPLWNSVSNAAASAVGSPQVKKFEATKKAVVDELTRAWRGSGGSEGDIKTWASTLDAANSPEQLHGVIGQLGELLESKIGSLNDQYQKGMGTAAGGLNLMSPNSQKVLERIKQRAGMDTTPTSPQSSSGVLNYNPSTGRFE